jgi:SAM-dependent methyltransferase
LARVLAMNVGKSKDRALQTHYGRDDLGVAILSALRAAGADLENLTPDVLAPMDEFHTRGRAGTDDLARLLALTGVERVIDIGCGIGGPARFLAHTFGCRVSGVDLTPAFVHAANMLAEMTGLHKQVDYREGDALALPFPAESFDVAWSQNVVMNILDRPALYGEIRRVLKPRGRYAFADVVALKDEPIFPVPWASERGQSFLLGPDETRAAIEQAGFRILAFEDQTADAIVSGRKRLTTDGQLPPLGIHVLFGDNFRVMAKNAMRNYEEGRIGLVQGVAERD